MRMISLIDTFFLMVGLSFSFAATGYYSAAATTQQNHPEQTKTKGSSAKSSELQHLLDQARLVPAEFQSDALIRLAQSRFVKDRELKKELLEEAFDAASGAQFQARKTAFAPIEVDTRLGYLASAYALNLDAVSLRCRVVEAMLDVDKARARNLFLRIRLMDALGSPLTCKDGLIYDVSVYYKTLKRVSENCFSPKEVQDGDKLNFVEEGIDNILSPVELSPAGELITSIDWSEKDLQDLINRYSVKLAQMSADFRTFYASESVFHVTESIYRMMSYAEKRQASVQALVETFRAYIIRNLSQASCDDIDSKEIRFPYFVRTANRLLFPHNPIAPDEIRSSGVSPSYTLVRFWISQESKLMLDEVRKLRFKNGRTELTASERETLQWDNDLNRVMNRLDDWKVEDEAAKEDYFHEKAVIYRSLLELVTTDKQRDEVLRRFLLFLKDVDPDHFSRVELYWHMRTILEATRGSDGEPKRNVLDTLLDSDNRVLRLYASLRLKGL